MTKLVSNTILFTTLNTLSLVLIYTVKLFQAFFVYQTINKILKLLLCINIVSLYTFYVQLHI